jgi:23S rRNA (guanine745-N1)-methyltransferase
VDPRIVARLRCPVCAAPLAATEHAPRTEFGRALPAHTAADRDGPVHRALRCPSGHSFDIARQGYADLAVGRVTHPGDTGEMIAARARVQGAGHFDFLTRALVEAVDKAAVGLIVDVGAGTAGHLAAVLEHRPDAVGLAVDVSKAALRRAARAHPRIGAVRADAWRGLPVSDGAAACVLNVFAPRHGAEFARILAPAGRLIVVTPAPDHLRELGLAVGIDPRKDERLSATLAPWFVREDERAVRTTLRLSDADAAAVAAMGPSAFHAGTPVGGGTITAAARLSVWRSGED